MPKTRQPVLREQQQQQDWKYTPSLFFWATIVCCFLAGAVANIGGLVAVSACVVGSTFSSGAAALSIS